MCWFKKKTNGRNFNLDQESNSETTEYLVAYMSADMLIPKIMVIEMSTGV